MLVKRTHSRFPFRFFPISFLSYFLKLRVESRCLFFLYLQLPSSSLGDISHHPAREDDSRGSREQTIAPALRRANLHFPTAGPKFAELAGNRLPRNTPGACSGVPSFGWQQGCVNGSSM